MQAVAIRPGVGVKRSRNTNEVDPRSLDEAGEPLRGPALMERIREIGGDTVLLSFSGGKDSLAAWLFLRPHFKVVPYYLYAPPGMSWQEPTLAYYEEFFETRIIRMAHPLFYDWLRTFAYQPPETLKTLRALDLPQFDYAEIDDLIAWQLGLIDEDGQTPFCALGMRASDNLERRRMIQQQGVFGQKKRRFFYPIWDWSAQQVADIIIGSGAKLALEYRHWGRTEVGITYPQLKPMAEHYPDDWRRFQEWFPLAGAELFRWDVVYEWVRQKLTGSASA
jgi:hypothetical protein